MNKSIWLSAADFVRKNVWDSVLTSVSNSVLTFVRNSANHSVWRSIIVVRRFVQNSVEHSVSQSIKEMNNE